MNVMDTVFFEVLKVSLNNMHTDWKDNISLQDWTALFVTAKKHHVLPMIYEAVCSCPAFKKLDSSFIRPIKMDVFQDVLMQERKTTEVLKLLQWLQDAGVQPLVVKGLICRNLYPKPDYRFSVDEDILIPENQYLQCHEAMMSYGMNLIEPEKDIFKEYEVPYGKQGSTLHIELHKKLFPPDSGAYGELNHFFETVFERTITETIRENTVYTLNHTDHLFYLICHAFKHFLHSGFGIRQVCDITMYANMYGKEIDWLQLLKNCQEIRAEKFAAALFAIGKNYLTFSEEKSCYPLEWRKIIVDETLLLEDLMSGGVFGSADMERMHSSNITLNAVSDQKRGKKYLLVD